jgi:hypothetical protein
VRRTESGLSARFTIIQRGMPFEGASPTSSLFLDES